MRQVTAAACALALACGAGLAWADGPPETPPYRPPPAPAAQAAPLRPAPVQVAPAPAQAPVRAAPLQRQSAAPAPAAPAARAGQISLADGAVTLTVPAGFELLSPAEAQAYLQRAGAPAPRGDILGLVAPVGVATTSADFWGSVLAYEALGYVPPDNAAALTAPAFEGAVRTARTSAARGFERFETAPAFSPAGALSWAERTAPDGPATRNIRHEQRALGRGGVASLTSVVRANQLGQLVAAMPAFMQGLSFPAGQRYGDATASDRRAAVDLPGLVTGEQNVASAAAATGQGFVQTNAGGQAGGAGLQGLFPWIALGVIALAALGWFAMGRRDRAADSDDYDDEDEADERPAAQQASAQASVQASAPAPAPPPPPPAREQDPEPDSPPSTPA